MIDLITLHVIGHQLRGIAEEMEAVLVRGAYSPNITERRDCSTAICDANGKMIAQSASIPVHLGAMPAAVEAVIACAPEPGDVWVLNDPYHGGSHLPDLTMVSPIDSDGVRVGYAISRAHHADIGGSAAGSMPAGSRELVQEGLILPPVRFMAAGRPCRDVENIIVRNSRTPHERIGDLRAQAASHIVAAREYGRVSARWGIDVLQEASKELLAYARRRMRAAIEAIPDGSYRAVDYLEGDGITNDLVPIQVTVTVAGGRVRVDFSGTAHAVAGNLNCPLSVTQAAVYFVFRCVTDPDIPSSSGAFDVIEVVAPQGSMVNAQFPSAVAAGNVETSSRIVDVLFSALGQAIAVPAHGQGTMNNVTIGSDSFTYYETIGGGQGASIHGPGPSGVHVAMSNTLNTPVEVLETTYPVRVMHYRSRPGTGGRGVHVGGDGVSRSFRLRAPAYVSVISERRLRAPHGSAGGENGHVGRNTLNGEPLPAKWQGHVATGDTLVIDTPGGGGWGPPPPDIESA